MDTARDFPARTASTSARTTQAGREQRAQLTGKLQKLLLTDLAPDKKRLLLAQNTDGSLAWKGDAQRDTAHFTQAQDNAPFGVSLHYAFDDFAGLVGGSVLKKSHAY
jgi:hypothetical protein